MKVLYRGPVSTDSDEEMRICPQCDGDGWSDEYDEEVCDRCWGECEVPV